MHCRCANLARGADRRRSPRPRSATAFTLMEMMVVLAVVAILATVAIPRFGGSISGKRLDAAARRVQLDLSGARDLARRTSQGVRVRFTPGSDAYSFVGVASVDRPADVYRVELAREPYGVTIDSLDLGGDEDVIFDGFGTPDSDGLVVLRCGTSYRTIRLEAATGVAVVE